MIANITKRYVRGIYMKIPPHVFYHEWQRQVHYEGVLENYLGATPERVLSLEHCTLGSFHVAAHQPPSSCERVTTNKPNLMRQQSIAKTCR